jgi:hypothetical protein
MTCERFLKTAGNALTEINNLGKEIVTKASQAGSHLGAEAGASMDRVTWWLRGEIENYHALVLFLREKGQSEYSDSLALMLCQSVGADIIMTCVRVQDQLQVIASAWNTESPPEPGRANCDDDRGDVKRKG